MLIEASKHDLIALGFPQFTIEDFHDVVSSRPAPVIHICACMPQLQQYIIPGHVFSAAAINAGWSNCAITDIKLKLQMHQY